MALQLALCYTIGFGTIKNDKQATSILRDHSLKNTDLRSQVQLIIDITQEPPHKSGLFSLLQYQGTVPYVGFPLYYHEKILMKRAEMRYKSDVQSMKSVFGQSHLLYLIPKAGLASIFRSQGRWKDAEKLNLQIIDISDEDKQEGAGRGASRHAEQHSRPRLDIQASRTMEER